MRLSEQNIRDFRETVYEHYRQHGRDFPWRRARSAYQIWVSEVMLQQTQADRAVPKYREFLKRFPSLRSLAEAKLSDVLLVWQGLGYNRRAKHLKEAAELIVREHSGRLPTDEDSLKQLPGIGAYTAAAIAAFAGNQPSVVIETNIRSVFIHHFFGDREGITDSEIEPLVAQVVDRNNPREWYHALMDYGAHLKRQGINSSRRSAHYARQGTFAGSDRQIRGQIIKSLVNRPDQPAEALFSTLTISKKQAARCLEGLIRDGMIKKRSGKVFIA